MTNAEAGPSRAPEPGTPPKPRRRSWFDFSSPSSSFTNTPPRKSSITSTRRGSQAGDEEVEMSEAGGSRLRSSMSGTDADIAEDGEELLTIDGRIEPNQTIKKKKKRGKSHGAEEEVVRLKELKAPKSKEDLKTSFKGLAYDPGGDKSDQFPKRTFSRIASDRDPAASHTTPPLGSETHDTLTPTPPPTHDSSFITPSDRPLPPLPGDSDKVLPNVPLSVPRGIVITPSSPRKLVKRPNASSSSSSLNQSVERRSRSADTSKSRSSSQTRRARSARSSPIGIGLPRSLGGEGNDEPPPLPIKNQSVSSPFPARGHSPTPRIVFAEPDGPSKDKEDEQEDGKERKTRLKRARSFSGFLSKMPQVETKPSSRPHTPEPEEEETTVKASGVLGWLGVKKTVKRRQSEGKLQTLNAAVEQNQSREVSPHRTEGENGERRESLAVEGLAEDDILRSRRPDLGTQSSSVTVMPDGAQSKRGFFGRRSTSRGGESRNTSPRPIPMSINTNRQSTINSSQSSLQLPQIDPTSPGLFNPDTWASSPPEGEETLFSPGSGSNWGPGVRPWMDGMEGGRSTRSSISISSPLDSLPEQGPPDLAAPSLIPPTLNTTGRVRSWSDAPLPQPTARPDNSSNPQLPAEPVISQSLQSSPIPPMRPKMPGRSNSGNSAIMGRMRNVFAKTTSRGRSQTLLRQASSDIDEFGNIRSSNEWPRATIMRPSSSSSSSMNSPGMRASGSMSDGPQLALLGLSNHDRHIFLNDTPGGSPRTSIAAASISSVASGSTRQSTFLEPAIPTTNRGRARASTMSAGPTSYSFVPPPSPRVFPISATPPRRRPSVIQRLSSGVLRSSGPSSPRNGSLFPLPPRSSGSMSSGFAGTPGGPEETPSAVTSPRPSSSSISAGMSSSQIKAALVREEGDTPEIWLDRVTRTISRNEISNVLASSAEDFVAEALRLHMARFNFTHDALDVALRRLLMNMSLPRETQQIDRIIEAFAVRYEECEPDLFLQKDNTYVLAFSMMMLHTDAFNRHNKNKMAKADYVRNTRMDGVHPLVLEAFYDNITFTPFVFIEDESDLLPTTAPDSAVTIGSMTPSFAGSTLSMTKNGKVDVYHMIVRNLLDTLRVEMESDVPPYTPFSCIGSRPFLNTELLHRAFATARDLAIVPPKRKNSTAGLLGSTPGKSNALPEAEMILKVTKVGLLSRKDDSPDSTKKSSRKWKSWSVILTGSQILFFKDPIWALSLLEQSRSSPIDENSAKHLLPRMTNFKPDEVFPVKDCIAVYDRDFTEFPHTFRFVMPPGRKYLLQASDEFEMNEWVALINYASTFKTANIRMRGISMGKDRAVLAGAAAAASHKRELQGPANVSDSEEGIARTPRKAVFGEMSETPEKKSTSSSRSELLTPASHDIGTSTTLSKKAVLDIDGANDVVANEGEQLEEVFDIVKAELAAGRGGATKRPNTVGSYGKETLWVKEVDPKQASRADLIASRIREFEQKVIAVEAQLQANLRNARNLAILTPFQKSTRDRISSAIPSLASKIRTNRLELAKLDLWITVLRKDLDAEQRDWARLRHVALQAAAKSLRDPLGVKGVVADVNAESQGDAPIPTLALPINTTNHSRRKEDEDAGSGNSSDGLSHSPGELPVIIRRPSDEPDRIRDQHHERARRSPLPRQDSAASYRSSTSAASSKPDLRRCSSDLLSARDGLSGPTSPLNESTGNNTPILFPLNDVDETSGTVLDRNDGTVKGTGLGINFQPKSQSVKQSLRTGTNGVREAVTNNRNEQQPKTSTMRDEGRTSPENRMEQAEDWSKTRASKRVSLANIPTDIPQRSTSRQVSQEGVAAQEMNGVMSGGV